ncbi:type II toxin-antitoxin system RelE/ParE family toxin [Rhodohalobacter barkolensis]|uniref:Plasmid stabilization protein n=1 Tax=Rhodohalobacter barkolensis TaxID=2053187 RepID=A0A2N0VEZ8_9BACT|nr:type II toxin-antitoxin system RelE/ParE family toxin [Rhodohalobacter barkolensis]PKD42771.1 plasmid stabilization protein [Rhodohalobacter barkolensis]
MTIKFHSEAKKEFFEAADYYEEQVVGLGDVFIDEVEKVLDVIEQQPASGTKITKTERRFLVSRFPYGIIYSVEEDQITIFAVMNLKRKPGYWKSRT